MLNIKTSFCFFDETGLLRSARDPFFAVGMIKCKKWAMNPSGLRPLN